MNVEIISVMRGFSVVTEATERWQSSLQYDSLKIGYTVYLATEHKFFTLLIVVKFKHLNHLHVHTYKLCTYTALHISLFSGSWTFQMWMSVRFRATIAMSMLTATTLLAAMNVHANQASMAMEWTAMVITLFTYM